MSFFSSTRPLRPRDGMVLFVLIVARISGCSRQKERSIEDQIDHSRQLVLELYHGPVHFIVVKTKAKGEALDRPELDEIEHHLRSKKIDLFVLEDLGRLVRGEEAVRLLGIGCDNGVRTLCPHDDVDTSEDGWQSKATSAIAGHIAHNEHTSRRIKMKGANRFKNYGTCARRPVLLEALVGADGLALKTEVSEMFDSLANLLGVLEYGVLAVGIWWVSRKRIAVESRGKEGV